MMNLNRLKEPFYRNELEFRIQSSGFSKDGNPWALVLAYISARAIMDRLDEVVGIQNWAASYSFTGENKTMVSGVICSLSLKIENEWYTKQDGAEQTDIENFKGGISSALKRAGAAWGAGRYLYNLPTMWAIFGNVTPKTEGARKSLILEKDRAGSVTRSEWHYWIPPELPMWALPEDEKAERRSFRGTPSVARREAVEIVKLQMNRLDMSWNDLCEVSSNQFGKHPDELNDVEYSNFTEYLKTLQ